MNTPYCEMTGRLCPYANQLFDTNNPNCGHFPLSNKNNFCPEIHKQATRLAEKYRITITANRASIYRVDFVNDTEKTIMAVQGGKIIIRSNLI